MGGTRQASSPATRSTSRLVATMATEGQLPRIRAMSSATESMTCSQLSRTRKAGAARRWARIVSSTERPGESRSPRARWMAASAAGPSVAVERSTKRHADEPCRARRESSRARRVFPHPPGPVSVTSRWVATSDSSMLSSAERPMNRPRGSSARGDNATDGWRSTSLRQTDAAGRVRPFSQRFTETNETPRRCASSSCVSPFASLSARTRATELSRVSPDDTETL